MLCSCNVPETCTEDHNWGNQGWYRLNFHYLSCFKDISFSNKQQVTSHTLNFLLPYYQAQINVIASSLINPSIKMYPEVTRKVRKAYLAQSENLNIRVQSTCCTKEQGGKTGSWAFGRKQPLAGEIMLKRSFLLEELQAKPPARCVTC